MTTLREVTDFTGVAGPAGQLPGAGTRFLSLRSCGDLVTAVVPEDQRHSLRSLDAALPTLPPISLAARVSDHEDVVTPSRPIIEVDLSGGAVVETVVSFVSGGVPVTPATSSAVRLVDGDRVDGTVFAAAVFTTPGDYEAVVRRVGVTGSGVVTLERRAPFHVRAVPSPTPAPTPSPTPAPAPHRQPLCQVELDLDHPGFQGVTNVRVSGSGFVPSTQIDVLEDDAIIAQRTANGFGQFVVDSVGLLDVFPKVTHRFRATSAETGPSNEAGFDA